MGYLSPTVQALAPLPCLQPVPKLMPGATIGLFSPSEPLTEPRLATLRESVKILTRQGYNIEYAPNALAQGLYAAGNVSHRVKDIHALAQDPSVDALWATWGGKQCNQLLPQLDFNLIAESQKPVIGFSDVAVLLNALTVSTGRVSFHFLVAGRLPETRHQNLDVLVGDPSTYSDLFDFHSGDYANYVFREGNAEGRLFGGNLSTFVLGLLGTHFLSGMQDIIFFWESASERPQIIDQHLTALRNSGFFHRVRGMVIGSAYSGGELSTPEIQQSIAQAVEGFSFPVVYSPTFGHLPTRNPIVPVGAMCRLETDSFSVQLLEPVVAK